MVEVDGAQYSNDQQLLSQLKYKAWNNCANGVINIKKSFKVRELSTTGSDGKKKHLFFNCIYRTGSENKDRFYFFKEVR